MTPRTGDQLVGVGMHTLVFDSEEWFCTCNRFRTVDVLLARHHAGLPTPLAVTPPPPPTPHTEAGRLALRRQLSANPGDWFGPEDLTEMLAAILAIETEAAGAALAALRAQVEALPARHINWYDAEGLHEEHCDVVRLHEVLALLSGAAPAAGERKFHDFSKWEPGVDVRADEAPAAGEPE